MVGGGPPEVQNLAVVLTVSQSGRPGNLRSAVMEGGVEVVSGGVHSFRYDMNTNVI